MARQVKIDYPRFPVPFTNTGNSIYHSESPWTRRELRRIRGGSAADRRAGLQGAKNNSPRE